MKHELQGYLKSGQPARAEDFRDPEPPADDDPAASGPVGVLQAEVARHLDRTAFPADTPGLVTTLEEEHAPGELVDAVRRLTEDGGYETPAEVARAPATSGKRTRRRCERSSAPSGRSARPNRSQGG